MSTNLLHLLLFKTLTLRNFLSVGNITQTVALNQHGLTLILGANTDSTGTVMRNGAGKSTILQAISYVLFGKPLTKIKIPNLINNINGKNMVVTLEFSRDGKTYRIERGRKPDFLRFYVDGEELKDDEAKGENRDTQADIDAVLGMSHLMFKYILALNTFTDPFFKMDSGPQRAFIEELIRMSEITRKADSLAKEIKATKEIIRDLEAKTKATNEANDRIRAAIKRAEAQASAWEDSHAIAMHELAESLSRLETFDFDAELARFDALDQWAESAKTHQTAIDQTKREISLLEREAAALEAEGKRYQREAEAGVKSQVQSLREDAERKKGQADRHARRITTLMTERNSVKAQIDAADSSECVCCGQKLQGTDHLRVVLENLETKAKDLTRDIEHENDEIKHLLDGAAEVETKAETLETEWELQAEELAQKAQAKFDEAARVRDSILGHADRADQAKSALLGLGDRPVPTYRTRDEVYRARQARDTVERDLELELQKTNPFTGQITEFEGTLQTIDGKPLEDATKLLRHQDFLFRLLSKPDSFIRKKIIDQNLAFLNSRMNHYLERLGLPHEVEFKSDLSVDITHLGRDFDFEQLSRGEMNRVIMATSWSFRDIWESTNVGCNLLWVDELLDQGTDAQAVEAALSILKDMVRDRNKNIFLISHREELQSRIDRTLMVRKENGFTTLEIDGVSNS